MVGGAGLKLEISAALCVATLGSKGKKSNPFLIVFFDCFLKTKQYSITLLIIDTYVLRKQSKKALKKWVTFLAFRYLSLYVATLLAPF